MVTLTVKSPFCSHGYRLALRLLIFRWHCMLNPLTGRFWPVCSSLAETEATPQIPIKFASMLELSSSMFYGQADTEPWQQWSVPSRRWHNQMNTELTVQTAITRPLISDITNVIQIIYSVCFFCSHYSTHIRSALHNKMCVGTAKVTKWPSGRQVEELRVKHLEDESSPAGDVHERWLGACGHWGHLTSVTMLSRGVRDCNSWLCVCVHVYICEWKSKPHGWRRAKGDGSTVTGSHVSIAGRSRSICQEGREKRETMEEKWGTLS